MKIPYTAAIYGLAFLRRFLEGLAFTEKARPYEKDEVERVVTEKYPPRF